MSRQLPPLLQARPHRCGSPTSGYRGSMVAVRPRALSPTGMRRSNGARCASSRRGSYYDLDKLPAHVRDCLGWPSAGPSSPSNTGRRLAGMCRIAGRIASRDENDFDVFKHFARRAGEIAKVMAEERPAKVRQDPDGRLPVLAGRTCPASRRGDHLPALSERHRLYARPPLVAGLDGLQPSSATGNPGQPSWHRTGKAAARSAGDHDDYS